MNTVDESKRVGVVSCQMKSGVEIVDGSNRAVRDK